MKKSIIWVALALLILQVRTDLPINCYNSQISGKWKFKLTEAKQMESPVLNQCGHRIPDHQNTSYKAKIDQSLLKLGLELDLKEDGDIELVSIDNVLEPKQVQSEQVRWSMVYNEGFEIRYKGIIIMLFNEYNQYKGKFKCNCGKSLLGWYKTADDLFGCVVGQRSDGKDMINDGNVQGNIVLQGKVIPRKSEFRFKDQKNRFLKSRVTSQLKTKIKMSLQFKEHQLVVDRINQINGLTWKAKVNKVFANKTIKQVNKYSGRNIRFTKQVIRNKEDYMNLNVQIEEYFKNKNELKYFDWSKEINYMPKAREQKDCGSCYVIAALSMVDFRLRIKQNRQKRVKRMIKSGKKQQQQQQQQDTNMDSISVQQAMDCCYYNQGCDGGYAMLVGKFGKEQLLIEEKYKPYSAHDMKCSNIIDIDSIKQVVKVNDYGYVGGRYGNSNHFNIMKDIRENGPVVLSFSPDDSFQYYSSGIYQSLEPIQWIQQNIERPEWSIVDHSVLCYGWGEENGVKYWLCQNSWGDSFGDKGTFKIKRGEDTMGIESSAEFITPYIENVSQNNNKQILLSYKKM